MVHHYVTDIAHHHGTPTKHGREGDGQLRLSVSPTLQARLAREAAERGMGLEDWAVLKLGPSRNELGDAEWLQRSGAPRTVQHHHPSSTGRQLVSPIPTNGRRRSRGGTTSRPARWWFG